MEGGGGGGGGGGAGGALQSHFGGRSREVAGDFFRRERATRG